MTDVETSISQTVATVPLEPWTAPILRVCSASAAEINLGGAVPDLEGTS